VITGQWLGLFVADAPLMVFAQHMRDAAATGELLRFLRQRQDAPEVRATAAEAIVDQSNRISTHPGNPPSRE
jgi:hypothetical protein